MVLKSAAMGLALAATLAFSGFKASDPAKVSASQALNMLREGNNRFVLAEQNHPNQDAERRLTVAKGQSPFAIVLTCADSRVSPELLFDQGIGDLFVIRVAGNIPEPGGIASAEYAVEHLGARLIVVLGHERCGAVKAACDAFISSGKLTYAGSDEHGHKHAAKPAAKAAGHEKPAKGDAHGEGGTKDFLPELVAQIVPSVKAVAKAKGDMLENAIIANVSRSVGMLSTRSKTLHHALSQGELQIVGAYYDLDTGAAHFFNQIKAY
jgi:carbonic anhydrase